MRKPIMTKATSASARRPTSRAALMGIRHGLLNMQTQRRGSYSPTPRTIEAGLWALYGFMASSMLLQNVQALIADLRSLLGSSLGLVPFVTAFAAFLFAQHRGKASLTWQDDLLRRLSLYEPVDKAAYRELQQRVAHEGHAAVDAVHEWLETEMSALQANVEVRPGLHDFVSRKV